MGGFLAFEQGFGNAPGVWDTLTAHRKFESTMALPTVQEAAKAIATMPAQAARRNPLDSLPPPPGYKLDAPPHGGTFGGIPVDSTAAGAGSVDYGALAREHGGKPLTVSADDIEAYYAQDGGITILPASALLKGNRDGINSIQFDLSKKTLAIGFTTGEWVYRTEAPKFSAYLVLLAFPAFGFLLPWAAVRLVTWVGTGFFAQQPR